jgi:hypothetical protein
VARNLFRILLVLWAGSLWSLAAWVAPIMFHAQPDRHLAGMLAARFFTVETYLGIAVAAVALALPGRGKMPGLYAAATLLAVNEWGLKRYMEAARIRGTALGLSFGAWHGTAAILYVVASLAVLLVIWKQDLR